MIYDIENKVQENFPLDLFDLVKGTFSDNDSKVIFTSILKYFKNRLGYHDINHIIDVTKTIMNHGDYQDSEFKQIFLAVLYHDIVYDPTANNNEELSSSVFVSDSRKLECVREDSSIVHRIAKAISKTKNHKDPQNPIEENLFFGDLYRILNNTYKQYLEDEALLKKEYLAHVPLGLYLKGRIKFLVKFLKSHKDEIKHPKDFQQYIDHIKETTGRVAVYAGTFNPVHAGHLDIVRKSLRMYDQVIMLVSINPEKIGKASGFDFEEEIRNRVTQCRELAQANNLDNVCGIPNLDLTPYYLINRNNDNDNCEYHLVRGLRDGYDLDYEIKNERMMREFNSDIDIIYITSDPDYSHISSSAIRNLTKLDKSLSNPKIRELIKKYQFLK